MVPCICLLWMQIGTYFHQALLLFCNTVTEMLRFVIYRAETFLILLAHFLYFLRYVVGISIVEFYASLVFRCYFPGSPFTVKLAMMSPTSVKASTRLPALRW